MISQFLDTNGNGTGTNNAIGDYSSAAEEFYFQPSSGETYSISRMIVTIEDTSGFSAQEYGNLGAALTNGITIKVMDGETVDQNLTEVPIIKNGQWPMYCHDSTLHTYGAGDEVLTSRWTFAKSGQSLNLSSAQKLVVTLNDDFTGLISHRFLIQGHRTLPAVD